MIPGRAAADTYLNSGCVAELETRFAKLLGKERAVFVPTGTLANHLALRCLAGGKSRVFVPAESHIYNDSSDCVPVLMASATTAEVSKTPAATTTVRCRRAQRPARADQGSA